LFIEALPLMTPTHWLRKNKTPAGLAIDTRSAALCIFDMMRTRKFLLGIRDAIDEKLRIDPGQPVTILYAGTGPFATLLTPLITVFRPDQLQMVVAGDQSCEFSLPGKNNTAVRDARSYR
jgi:hypothetical protein